MVRFTVTAVLPTSIKTMAPREYDFTGAEPFDIEVNRRELSAMLDPATSWKVLAVDGMPLDEWQFGTVVRHSAGLVTFG